MTGDVKSDRGVRRPVPTLIHDGKAWVEAVHYDQTRTDNDYIEDEARGLRAENERLKTQVRLLNALGDFSGCLPNCDALSGAPDCTCGYVDLFTQVREEHRSLASDEQEATNG